MGVSVTEIGHLNTVVDEASTEGSVLDRVSAFGNDSIVVAIEQAATDLQLYNLVSSFQELTGRPRFVLVVNDSGKSASAGVKVMTNWPHELFDQAQHCGLIDSLVTKAASEKPGGDSCPECLGISRTEQLFNSDEETAELTEALAIAKLDRTHCFAISLGAKTDARMVGLLDGTPPANQAEVASESAFYRIVGNKILSLAAQETSKTPVLSKRETECIRWTAEGKTSYEIGIILGLSENTINNYIASVTKKMGAVNRSHMISLAFRNKIIS